MLQALCGRWKPSASSLMHGLRGDRHAQHMPLQQQKQQVCLLLICKPQQQQQQQQLQQVLNTVSEADSAAIHRLLLLPASLHQTLLPC
jgi:hypothetical protein